MDKTDNQRHKGEGRREVDLENGWNARFDHVRRMMAYD